jgi:long-subunit fatty acid transport protein
MGQVKLAAYTALLLLTAHGTAVSAPLKDARLGGLSLVGPSSPHPASFLYNPAALGLMPPRVLSSVLDTTVHLSHGDVQRRPIDTTTGEPSDAASAGVKRFDSVNLFEVFPHPLLGISSSIGSDSVVVSLSGHTAAAQNISFNGDGDAWFDGDSQGPTRYTATDLIQYHLFGTLAASWRIADFLIVGASFSLTWGALDLGFVRDGALDGGRERDAGETVALDDCGGGVPCGYESDAAAEAVRVKGTGWGFGFALGLVVRPHPSVDIGAAYTGRPLGFDGQSPVARGDAWVRRSRASFQNAVEDPSINQVERDLSGRGSVTYVIPDAINFGATWRLSSRLRLNAQLRWINYSEFEQLTVRLSGSMFRRHPAVPERVDHYRGFQDVWIVQLGGGFRLREQVELQTGLMVETAAVPTEAVTPVTVDTTKVDWLLAVTWDIGPYLTLRAGYSLGVMPGVDVDSSAFSPAAMVSCVEAQYDIDLRECKAAAAGRGLPTTAGSYSLLSHRLGTSLTFHLQ